MELLWAVLVFGPFLAPLGGYLLGCLLRRRSFVRPRFAPVGWYYTFLTGAIAIMVVVRGIRTEPRMDMLGLLLASVFIGIIFWGLGFLLGFAMLFAELKRDDTITHLCRQCRYDLTGNLSGVCPECGAVISREQREMLDRQQAELGDRV
jgi:hypothetical protein